ncbi:MAG: Ldh family oxidoreductase [Mesorhizobium sp.]|nr:MAG: Ldh family oxidoreductase [Mesorhizobium sp.]
MGNDAVRISIADLTVLLTDALEMAGALRGPSSVARSIAMVEREGSSHHGLVKLRDYVDTLNSGWVNGQNHPVVTDGHSAVLRVDADNGFAQPVLEDVRDALSRKARSCGIALLSIRNSHHYSALWPDILPYARDGLLAFAFLNSRSRLAPFGGNSKLFGTNPMAFACPRLGGPPVVWDQASSIVSAMQLVRAEKQGEELPEGIGIDRDGKPTTDPARILAGGAQLPFGAHKGSMIALTVEIMAAALTGAAFGFEDSSPNYPGAMTSNAGLSMIVIDPRATSSAFEERVSELCAKLAANGAARVPGETRDPEPFHNSEYVVVDDRDFQNATRLAARKGS